MKLSLRSDSRPIDLQQLVVKNNLKFIVREIDSSWFWLKRNQVVLDWHIHQKDQGRKSHFL